MERKLRLKTKIQEMAGILIEQPEPPTPPVPPTLPKEPTLPIPPTKPNDEIEIERQNDFKKIKKFNKIIQGKMALGEDTSYEERMIKEILLKWQYRKMPLINKD
jgi:hypothetical protein